MNEVQDILKKCTVEGTVVKLPPGQLERKLYQEVAKSLELIGGKWKGGKVMGFQFKQDPAKLLSQIANGEKRNLKKEFQFFATPDTIADEMVRYANIQPTDIVLEQIAENTTDAWEDDLEDTKQVVVLENFNRKVQGETYDKDPSVVYNGWYERLKQLSEII